MGWTRLVSLELTDDEKIDTMACVPSIKNQPDYPYGLRINLNEGSLKKLEAAGLEGQPEIGDYIDLRCFARVTSVSSNETDGGANRCVELQIEQMALESESDEKVGG